ADSVRVVYSTASGAEVATPFRAASAASDTITVLGLHASTSYTFHVEAIKGGVSRSSPNATFQTAALPAALANVKLTTVSGKQSKYAFTGVQTSAGGYAVAFDSTGEIAWYHDLTATGFVVSTVVQQFNGNITAFVGNTSGWTPVDGFYVEIT